MGKYITQEAVLVRLRGKVKTTDNPDNEPDRMPVALLNRLIAEAEGQVETDLSPRYHAPFQGICGEPFAKLPQTTQNVIKTLCELLSVIRVLETDFGRGSAINAEAYTKTSQARYDMMIFGNDSGTRPGLISIRENSFNIFRLPPLPNLKSAYQVAHADNGFAGYVAHTGTTGDGGYPAMQINDPSENFWNGGIDIGEDEFL